MSNIDGVPKNRNESAARRCVAEMVQATPEGWSAIKDDVMSFEEELFGLEEDEISYAFQNTEATVVILRDTNTSKVIGITYAEPVDQAYQAGFHPEREKLPGAVYIQNTALNPAYMKQGLVGPLMDCLEEALRAKRYKFIERDSMTANSYAENIKRKYRDRIMLEIPHSSKWGDQVFFRIALNPLDKS
jgi:hypothetical protein